MKLKTEELTAHNYVLLEKMDHVELIPFVKKFLSKKTCSSIFYYAFNMVMAGIWLFFFILFYKSGYFSLSSGISNALIGFAIAFALIPVHEFIHALAYKIQGASQTSYDVNLKKFYFLAIADKFVANRQEFRIVALAPFTLISAALIATCFFTGHLWTITILTVLLIHASFCSGDFALLSYFEFNKDKEVVTYDDKANRVSFFYGRER